MNPFTFSAPAAVKIMNTFMFSSCCALLASCSRPAPSPAASEPAPLMTAPQAGHSLSPCEDPLEIVLPAGLPGAPTATFEVEPSPHPAGPALGCHRVTVGQESTLSRGHEVFTIAAHPTQLQRVRVGLTTALVHIVPGQQVVIGPHACFVWQFIEPPLQPQDGAAATLVSLSPPSAWTRPVTYTEVGSATRDEPSLPGPLDDPLELGPAPCGFTRVSTGAERVALAVGHEQIWTLRVDASGKLSGSARAR